MIITAIMYFFALTGVLVFAGMTLGFSVRVGWDLGRRKRP